MGLKTSATDALPVRTSEEKRVPPAQENPITMHQLRGLNNHYRSYIVYADRKLGYGIECVSVLMFLT